jgi:hypothetical protein
LKLLPDEETQRKSQPIRRWYATSLSSGARDTTTNATSWCSKCGMLPAKPSVTAEQLGQPSVQSGSNMK